MMDWLWLAGISVAWVLASPTFWWTVIIATGAYHAGKRRER